LTPTVYAKAVSNNDEDREDFTLTANQTVQLHIPVHEGTSGQIAYGVYMASGRAIYLNTIYIRVMKGAVTLYTDKSVYTPGQMVTVNVATGETGDLIVTTTTGYSTTIPVAGPASFSFPLPEVMVSGIQSIKYYLGENSGSCKFDIIGYSLKCTNVTLNKETFDPVDELSAKLTVKSSAALSVVVKGWSYSPGGEYAELFEVIRDLGTGENDIGISSPFTATVAGTHKFVYGIYSSGSNLTLVTGSKSFDVKPAAIITVATDKTTYNETDQADITIRTYTCGDYAGSIEIVNGNEVVAATAPTK